METEMRDRQDWTRELRPDELTSARLRRAIGARAEPLLAARREDLWSVASGWAGVLIPVAAMATLVFAGIAVRGGTDGTTVALSGMEPATDVVETVGSETVPAGFRDADAAADDVVFAALGEAAWQRPAPATRRAADGPGRP